MNYFLLIIGLLIFPLSNYAQDDSNTSITKTSWFWPLLSVCLALIFSIPCTLIAIVVFCYKKNRSEDFDESSSIDTSSSSSSSSSSLSTPAQRRHICHNAHLHRSHFAGGFRSPPPPYSISGQPENILVAPSLPPPYVSHINAMDSRLLLSPNSPTTVINVQPTDSSENQSLSTNPRLETTLDISSTIADTSMQTFQV